MTKEYSREEIEKSLKALEKFFPTVWVSLKGVTQILTTGGKSNPFVKEEIDNIIRNNKLTFKMVHGINRNIYIIPFSIMKTTNIVDIIVSSISYLIESVLKAPPNIKIGKGFILYQNPYRALGVTRIGLNKVLSDRQIALIMSYKYLSLHYSFFRSSLKRSKQLDVVLLWVIHNLILPFGYLFPMGGEKAITTRIFEKAGLGQELKEAFDLYFNKYFGKDVNSAYRLVNNLTLLVTKFFNRLLSYVAYTEISVIDALDKDRELRMMSRLIDGVYKKFVKEVK